MNTVLVVILLAGILSAAAGWIWGMVVARRISVAYFAGVALVAILALPYMAANHWRAAKLPFLLFTSGIVVMYVAALLLPSQ